MLAYFDCFSGLAGDMIVAALVDAGADWDQLRHSLAKLGLPGFEVTLETVKRGGLRSRLFAVRAPAEPHHRSFPDIISIINQADLQDGVKTRAKQIFTNLAEAEAKVHDCEIDHVHFHEVGAVDAIVDVVGSCVCLELLGIDEVIFPAVPLGSGTVRTAHGELPVPAPATAELLRGFRCYGGGQGELTTPTGAAILTTIGMQVVGIPHLKTRTVGYGAGARDDQHRPNVLRIIVGEKLGPAQADVDEIGVLSCQVDDMTGEELGLLAERLWSAGVLDVVQIPIYMKKGRPGVMLEVIVPTGEADRLAELILRHSTSFGVRRAPAQRYKLSREMIEVTLPSGTARVKLGYFAGELVQISPEYEDCRRLSLASGPSLREIYRQAVSEALRMIKKDTP
jgi:hypothetical protein